MDLVNISIVKVLNMWKIPVPDAVVSTNAEEMELFKEYEDSN